MYTLIGELTKIEEVRQVSDSFKKREFVVTDNSGKYPQTILLQVVQDRCEILDKVKVGQLVEVSFFLNGREWTNPKDGVVRYFNSLDAWKVEPLVGDKPVETSKTEENFVSEVEDGLPF